MTAICPSCGGTIDVSREFPELIQAQEALYRRVTPTLEIGTRGRFENTDWEVIGYLRRRDADAPDEGEGSEWAEYLLFNPYRGFRWLVEAEGHWNWVTMTKARPSEVSPARVVFRGTVYKPALKGRATVTFVRGEFYWRVKVGDTADTGDYLSGNDLLTVERSDDEEVWSTGRYIYPDEVREAFGLEHRLTTPSTVGINEPDPYRDRWRRTWPVWLATLGVLVMIQIFCAMTSPGTEVLSFVIPRDESHRPVVSPSFHLDRATGNLEIVTGGPVYQGEVHLEGTLVNDRTGETFEVDQNLSYYSGSDPDGPWVEGSQVNTLTVPAVPGGDYHLTYQVSPGSQQVALHSRVRRAVTSWANFWFAMLLVTLYPLYLVLMFRTFELLRPSGVPVADE